VRLGLGLCAIALTAAAGCTSGPADSPASTASTPSAAVVASPPPWTEPAKYGYVLDRQCGGGPSEGKYQVTVAAGKVVKADRIDGRAAEGEEEIDVPSLRELLDMAQTAADDGGEVKTTVDPKDGHPASVSIDVSDDSTTDGRSCFTITNYAPAG
jgi:thiamine biosynthesis lipoprotein ApbE